MEKIKELIKQPLVLACASLVLGLILGLVVLGWGLWPVSWSNASPHDLQMDYQRDYLCMIIDSYVRNQNQDLMRLRWNGLENHAGDLLRTLTPQTCRFTSSAEIDSFKALMNISGSTSQNQVSATPTAQKSNMNISFLPVMLFCLLTLVAGGVFAYLLIKRGKGHSVINKNVKSAASKTEIESHLPNEDALPESLVEAPLAQFMTSYRMGEDLYDESFSIDSQTGEFLGECGVGIADTIGVGDPKKVSALEMWLFDKNDIQTVTKVLLSEYAYADENIRQRLLSKGEPILAKPAQQFIMETASLQLEAKVIDMVYGRGPLPENSFFSRLTLQISVWQKVH